MFEIITQSQPQDYQSLEILKEAYSKLGREEEVMRVSRRIAQAYVQLGQLSSAILEYENILQRHPDDLEALEALGKIENQANTLSEERPAVAETERPAAPEMPGQPGAPAQAPSAGPDKIRSAEIDDGRQTMFKLFVESKTITNGDFDLCWPHSYAGTPGKVVEPFIQALADRGTLPVDRSLKILCDKSRLGYLPIERYDVDYELVRSFSTDLCRRWCVLPFDRMSKCTLVATANPYNRQAAKEMEAATNGRLLWYLSPPQDIIKALKKAFR